MAQLNIFPSEDGVEALVQNKIILLLFIDKMDLPISHALVCQFAVEEDYMNNYSVQTGLGELVAAGYLDRTKDESATRYTITEEGANVLELFLPSIPSVVKSRIQKYVTAHRKTAKQDFEVTATHFYDHKTDEYNVKCGIYDDEMTLLEVHISVVSKEQAISVCNRWKTESDILYRKILELLVVKKPAK